MVMLGQVPPSHLHSWLLHDVHQRVATAVPSINVYAYYSAKTAASWTTPLWESPFNRVIFDTAEPFSPRDILGRRGRYPWRVLLEEKASPREKAKSFFSRLPYPLFHLLLSERVPPYTKGEREAYRLL